MYTERIASGATGATMGGLGYYNPGDPTLKVNQIVKTPYSDGPQDNSRVRVAHTAKYQSDTAVNKDRNSGCVVWCAETGGNEGLSSAVASGHANAETLRLGGYTRAESLDYGPGALATMDAKITTTFQLKSGTSGLADGTEVDLRWNYHLEGNTQVSGKSSPGYTGSLASASSSSVIRQLGYIGSGEGDTGEVASVDFDLDSQIAHAGYRDVTGLASGFQRWSASSNAGYSNSQFDRWEQEYRGDSVDISKNVNIDSRTGIFGLDFIPFRAKIGETYEIELSLHLFSTLGNGADPFQPNRYGSATNNYFGTLLGGVELVNASGVELQFENAAAASVPEPSTFALAGLGLLGTAQFARRRRG